MPSRLARLMPLLLGGVLASCGTISYAAKVGNTTISQASLDHELQQVSSNKAFVALLKSNHSTVFGPGGKSYTITFVDNILNRRITIDRIEQLENRLHVTPTALESQLGKALAEQSVGSQSVFAQFSASYQKQLISDTTAIVTLEAHLAHETITNASVGAYYAAHKGEFVTYCASEILTGTPSQGQAALAQLKSGRSFATVAAKYSQNAATASGGGAIGCGTLANYLQSFGTSFASAVAADPVNSPTQPIQLSQGWAVVEVTSKSQIPLSQASLLAVNDMASAGQAKLNATIAKASASTGLSVNPVYGTAKKVGGVLQVVPSSTKKSITAQYFTPKSS